MWTNPSPFGWKEPLKKRRTLSSGQIGKSQVPSPRYICRLEEDPSLHPFSSLSPNLYTVLTLGTGSCRFLTVTNGNEQDRPISVDGTRLITSEDLRYPELNTDKPKIAKSPINKTYQWKDYNCIHRRHFYDTYHTVRTDSTHRHLSGEFRRPSLKWMSESFYRWSLGRETRWMRPD